METKEEKIDHLLELARLKLSDKEKTEVAKDLAGILKYVDQLNEVDVKGIEPMTGGTINQNIVRGDEPLDSQDTPSSELIDDLVKKKDNFMEIPPVFS